MKFYFYVLLGMFLGCSPLAIYAEEDFDARLSTFTNTVDIMSEDDPDVWRKADADMPLAEGDIIRTGSNSSAEITLDNGGIVYLNANSSFKIASLKPSSSSFFLRAGSLVAKIHSLLKNTASRLEVRTPVAVCAVRGTEFGVEHDEATSETSAGVFDEGSLSVSSIDEVGNVLTEGTLGAGNEVRLRKGDKVFKPGRLQRFLRHKRAMERARLRLGILQKNWQRLSPQTREALRKRFLLKKAIQHKRAVNRQRRQTIKQNHRRHR